MIHPMIRRQLAAQSCVDRFFGRPYQPGKRDCVVLALHALSEMGVEGFDVGRYGTERGAVRAMRRAGFKSLIEGVDSVLPRIAPASALPGDIIALEAEAGSPFGCALTVAVGNGRVFGFFEGVGGVVQPIKFVSAWRVGCRK